MLKTYSEYCATAQAGAGTVTSTTVKMRRKTGGRMTATVATHHPRKTPPPDPTDVTTNRNRDPRFQGNGGHGATPDRTVGDYCVVAPATDPTRAPSARPIPAALERQFAAKIRPEILHRLGLAAGLLARIWSAAYEAAGRPELTGCAGVTFDQSYVVQNYPKPIASAPFGYLPEGYIPGQHQ